MPEQLTGSPTVYPPSGELLPSGVISEGRYEVRYARSEEELDELLKLRFEVFNVELGEGLESSLATGRDRDEFDAVCHHLIVVERATERIIGTYRLQTSAMAERSIGFYSDAEFDLSRLPLAVIADSVELGRACIAVEHRNTQVLFLLWKGLARYMAATGQRYLFGCCSLTSQEPAEGWAVMELLEKRGQVHPELLTVPRPGFECLQGGRFEGRVKIPKLFRIYLRHGALVCGPPAIDRRFKTIDYLVIFDVDAMDERRFRTFFG
ncbi:MAG: GNAT family N-acetyltransferase [bacterium]|nr:GNAT family N-acetyltransferase [bacterium]